MCSLVGLLGDINQAHIKAVQIFKTPPDSCFVYFACRSERQDHRGQCGEMNTGKACDSCEKPSDLPFLTLQQPTRERFTTTAGEGERKRRREGRAEGEKKKRTDGAEGDINREEDGERNEINRERSKDRGAEGEM